MRAALVSILTALVFATIAAAPVPAQTVTVTISSDVIDVDWQNATIADLPGPDGEVSFSEALIATSNTPGHETIAFAIPQSDWQLQWLYPGRAVLRTLSGTFWRSFDDVTIDGTTQTAFTGDTYAGGAEVATYGGEIYLNGDNSVFQGFDSAPVTLTGSNGLVTGNTGTTNITLYSGSGTVVQGNQGGTLKIDRSSNNVVTGNTLSRIRVLGWVGGGLSATNNRIGGPALPDRNFLTGYGYVNGEGLPGGSTIQLFDAIGTLVENNWIGTTPDGLSQGNLASTQGILFEGENHDTMIRGNRIAGILGHGQGPHHAGQLFGTAILIGGTGSGITIVGNTIGLNANDEPVLGSVTGIGTGYLTFSNISDIRIGGAAPGEGNVIAGHLLDGVVVGHNVPQVRLSRNSIHSNGGLGIDLITSGLAAGVTPNDATDADTGGNGLQNFPVLTEAVATGAIVQVTGTLNSTPSKGFTLDFFASPACDASGYGEAEVYLGSATVFTDASGTANFVESVGGPVAEGWVVTATATVEPLGATSEFSTCVAVTAGSPITAAPGLEASAGRVRLLPSYPNPFSGSTTIRYELPRATSVDLAVYDVAGRRVRTLVTETAAAGPHRVTWDGHDSAGRPVVNGVYFYRLRAEGKTATTRAVLAR